MYGLFNVWAINVWAINVCPVSAECAEEGQCCVECKAGSNQLHAVTNMCLCVCDTSNVE